MGLGPWSTLAVLSALASAFDRPEARASLAAESREDAAATETSFSSERSQSIVARPFTASFDTDDVLRVGSLKVEQRCIRTTMDMDPDSIETLVPRPLMRPYRRALDDAELAAPPDPPRYVRLTLDD